MKKQKNENIEQQSFAFDEELNVVDSHFSNKEALIVNEDGTIADENTFALDLIRGGRFNAKLFHEQYENNTELVLRALLSMQSNSNPLKKGGDSIAYRCNALITQNRQNYTIQENTLLDVITAKMSSAPEDNFYIITAKEIGEMLPYADRSYIYKIMSTATKSLNRSPFIFEIELEKGKKKNLEFQWNEVLVYNGANDLAHDENAYISFQPTKFFKILTISSTVMHGAHYSVLLSTQIQSKYVRNLFYYFESMKNYREYPTATPGVFTLSLEDFQQVAKYPPSYRTTDVRRFVLEPAEEEINNLKGATFNFRYEFIKTGEGGKKKRITHIKIIISKTFDMESASLKHIEETKVLPELNENNEAAFQVLKGIGLNNRECNDVLKKYIENNRDLIFLTQAIANVITAKNVKSKTALLCHIMDNGLNTKNNKMETEKGNKFHNFSQREYDFDELEKRMLENNI